MDAKRKEMDLLSNSIAAYAHIKGQSINHFNISSSHIAFKVPQNESMKQNHQCASHNNIDLGY
jgi:hypothetical protein